MNIRLAAPIAAIGAVLTSIALQASSQGSAEAGAAKVAVCVACHGMNGNSTNPVWPSLAGQQARYIEQQLRLFRGGERVDPLMSPMAAGLSDPDIADLAAYYAAQAPAGLEADPSYWRAGERLYRGGDVTRDLPSCMACHGPAGKGNGPAGYPALRAQHAAYTQAQLQAYVASTRSGGQAEIMQAIAKRLSPEDIRNLASYLQGMR